MLSKAELREVDISTQLVEFVLPEVEKRLMYADCTQTRLEQRATSFLRIVLSVLLAILAAVVALHGVRPAFLSPWLLAAAVVPLLVSSTSLTAAIWDKTRGAPGTDAQWWLQPGIINTDADGLTYMKACLVHDLEQRVQTAFRSNYRTVVLLRLGISALVFAPAAVVAVLMAGY